MKMTRHCSDCNVQSKEELCWVCRKPMGEADPFNEPGKVAAFDTQAEAEAAFSIQVTWANGEVEMI